MLQHSRQGAVAHRPPHSRWRMPASMLSGVSLDAPEGVQSSSGAIRYGHVICVHRWHQCCTIILGCELLVQQEEGHSAHGGVPRLLAQVARLEGAVVVHRSNKPSAMAPLAAHLHAPATSTQVAVHQNKRLMQTACCSHLVWRNSDSIEVTSASSYRASACSHGIQGPSCPAECRFSAAARWFLPPSQTVRGHQSPAHPHLHRLLLHRHCPALPAPLHPLSCSPPLQMLPLHSRGRPPTAAYLQAAESSAQNHPHVMAQQHPALQPAVLRHTMTALPPIASLHGSSAVRLRRFPLAFGDPFEWKPCDAETEKALRPPAYQQKRRHKKKRRCVEKEEHRGKAAL